MKLASQYVLVHLKEHLCRLSDLVRFGHNLSDNLVKMPLYGQLVLFEVERLQLFGSLVKLSRHLLVLLWDDQKRFRLLLFHRIWLVLMSKALLFLAFNVLVLNWVPHSDCNRFLIFIIVYTSERLLSVIHIHNNFHCT